jgi:hypothetical protein
VDEGGAGRGRVVERQPILLVGQNVFDRTIAIGAQPLGAQTRRFQTRGAMHASESHESETGAVALLRMRAPGEDAGGHAARGRARLLGPGDQPRRGPLRMRAVRPRHVGDLRGGPPAAREAQVGRDASSIHDHLDGSAREARLDVLVHQGVGHAVEVVIDLHVVINVLCGRPHKTFFVAFLLMWPSVSLSR